MRPTLRYRLRLDLFIIVEEGKATVSLPSFTDVMFFSINNSIYRLIQIRNTWKVLKCGAGEGWRRSVGSIM